MPALSPGNKTLKVFIFIYVLKWHYFYRQNIAIEYPLVFISFFWDLLLSWIATKTIVPIADFNLTVFLSLFWSRIAKMASN